MLAIAEQGSEAVCPISGRTVAALVSIWLQPDALRAIDALAQALVADPLVSAWVVRRASGPLRIHPRPFPRTIGELAQWLAAEGPRWWSSPSVNFIELEPEGATLDGWQLRVSLALHAGRAVLAGASRSRAADSPDYFDRLIGVDFSAGDATSDVKNKGPSRTSQKAAAVWRADVDNNEWSSDTIERLFQLTGLESQFQVTLEAEKLESLAELAAGAGHEINNPLAVIAGRAELLLRQETHPGRRHDLATIHAQAFRVRTLISDLMLFARPPEPRRIETQLEELVREVIAGAAARALAREVRVNVNVVGDVPRVSIDPTHMAVALSALLDNAIEASPTGRVVTVSIETAMIQHDSHFVRLTVSDDGPGISPEVRRHLFDPFFSGRQAGRGLGMGLAKAWRIVTSHGGTLRVESELGKGARFAIELPV